MKTINERTFEFAKEIVRICRKLEQDDKVTQAIGMQLLRAGTSIGANYEEALGGQSHADFTAKLSISLKEARETYYWLKLLAETQSLNPETL
jgi:four helix bundle protein